MARLTKRVVDAARPPDKGKTITWDNGIPGFGLAVYASGRRSYVLKYSIHGRQRWLTLGTHGAMTPERARKRAEKARGLIADNIDPAAERQREREQQTTVADLADATMTEVRAKKKSGTVRAYKNQLAHVRSGFGKLLPRAVSRDAVRRWHRKMSDTPSMANRALDRLTALMKEAETLGLIPRGSNPCRGVARYAEQPRTRFLSGEELARLGETIRGLEGARGGISADAATALRLLLFTGCRVGEILNLRWADVDLERGVANLADAKAGARPVLLPAPAVDLLLARRRENPDGEFVIPGQKFGAPMNNISPAWRRVREAADIEDVRLHDLRHTVGAWGASSGAPLLVIGKILGHRNAATTAIYAHLADDPVRAASEKIGAEIAAAMNAPTEVDDPVEDEVKVH